MEYYVSIDIGGTSIKYGIMTEDGEILRKDSMDTEAEKGGRELQNKVDRTGRLPASYGTVRPCIRFRASVSLPRAW